ncbi:NTP_transf_3 domain-containing protein [Azospirillaceae bacterium]
MQIVVPMSGFGERFRRAGYTVPKPLIEVDGKPIIAHIINLFPGAERFIFICNQDHLDQPEFRMRDILKECCPDGVIVGVAPHKLGPVHAVRQAAEFIDPDQPVIVNYCDFSCRWDFAAFQRFAKDSRCDGAVICYSGFHPHMLNSTNYAYVKMEEERVIAIQEKKPYTNTPMNEPASSGSYYFRTGRLMLEAFAITCADPELALNGEYYVSLAYRPLLQKGCNIAMYSIPHFMQWGTPEDIADYRSWAAMSRAVKAAKGVSPPRHLGAVLIPMAGFGARFASAGYSVPKPLIEVDGLPMVIRAARDLPQAPQRIFVLRRDMPGYEEISVALIRYFPGCRLVTLDKPTDGQARTCLLGMDNVALDEPLTIGACDNGAVYDGARLSAVLEDDGVDVVVWGVRGHPGAARHPQMYGWIDAEGDVIRNISVKTPLSDPRNDPIITGAFTFKRARDFVAAANRLIERGGAVNGEFYVDSAINDALALGLRCRLFEVDAYPCWGTPNDLKTYEYWLKCLDPFFGNA